MEPTPEPTDLDHCDAAAMLHAHLHRRAGVAVHLAERAAQAWADWVDLPAFARREQPHIGEELYTIAVAARKVADDAATLRPKFCTVELDAAAGRLRLLVGQA